MGVYHGKPPYLECSSKGDKRFSAFYATIKGRGNRSIEQIYQASKVFREPDGSTTTDYDIRDVKGLKPHNIGETRELYKTLWDEYISENPELLSVLREATGLCDRFGRKGSVCQASELWRIRGDV